MGVSNFQANEILVTEVKTETGGARYAKVVVCDVVPVVSKVYTNEDLNVGDIVIGSAKDNQFNLIRGKYELSPKQRIGNLLCVFENINERMDERINNNTLSHKSLLNIRDVYSSIGLGIVEVIYEMSPGSKATKVLVSTIARTIANDLKKNDDFFINKYGKVEKMPEKAHHIQRDVKNLRDDIISLGIVCNSKDLRIVNSTNKQQTLDLF